MTIKNRFFQSGYGNGTNWRGLFTLCWREFRRFLTIGYGTVLAPILTAILYFVVFRVSLGEVIPDVGNISFLVFLAPGLIVMAMIQNAFANNSTSIMIGKYRGTLTDFLMAPLSPLELAVGLFSGGVVRGCLIGIVGITVFSFIVDFTFHSIAMVIAFSILGCTMMALGGVFAAIISDSFDSIANISNFFITPMIFLSGTFYAIKTLPESLQVWAYINPFFYIIDGFRYGLIGYTDGSPIIGLVVLSTIDIIGFVGVWALLQSGYKTRD